MSRFSTLLQPYDPEDRRFDKLALRATASSIQLGNGQISALTFLFRCESDTLPGGGVSTFALHTSAPLTDLGQAKLAELYALVREALERALAALPDDIPLLRDNVLWITIDVRPGAPSEQGASVLAGFDFDRAQRAIAAQAKTHQAAYTGVWGIWADIATFFSCASAEKRAGSEDVYLNNLGRKADAETAASFANKLAAADFRRALETGLGPTLARVFAANLSPEMRQVISSRQRDPGRLTRVMGDGPAQDTGEGPTLAEAPIPVADDDAVEPPRLDTKFVTDPDDEPIQVASDDDSAAGPPRRETIVALDVELLGSAPPPSGPPPFSREVHTAIPMDPVGLAKGDVVPEPPHGLRAVRVDRSKSRPPS